MKRISEGLRRRGIGPNMGKNGWYVVFGTI